MIFLTVGSQKFQFNRLIEKLDQLIQDNIIKDEVYGQIGYSTYSPKNFKYKKFLDRDEFKSIINKSSIIVTHGGTGTIVNALKLQKKVIVVPRLKKYNEHIDDHQLQIVKEFEKMNLIEGILNLDELGNVLEEVKNKEFRVYESNNLGIIRDIDNYIESL